MKYKVGTFHAGNEILKNERINGKNYITMKCAHCNNKYTKPVSFLSSQLKRTGRMSCGCMTLKWKASKERKILPKKVKEWLILKEIKTKKYEPRTVLALCPKCREIGKYRFDNLKHTKMCQKCKGILLHEKSFDSYKRKEPRLYRIWQGMKTRCSNKNNKGYKNYGQKNIYVCKEWQIFEYFYEWAKKNKYTIKKEIHRINNTKGYYPDNCIWLTRKTHAAWHTVERAGFIIQNPYKE